MPKRNKHILNEEQAAIKRYKEEEKIISGSICKQMDKTIRKENLMGGLVYGLATGIIFGALAGDNQARQPVYDDAKTIINYEFDANKLADFVLKSIAVAVIAALAIAEFKTRFNIKRNTSNIQKMSDGLLEQYFNTALRRFDPLPNTSLEMSYLVYMRAAALIINNMPDTELNRIHKLIKSDINNVTNGHQVKSVFDLKGYGQTTDTVAQIISNHINYNPELKENVLAILHGNKPKTYFLPANPSITYTNMLNQHIR